MQLSCFAHSHRGVVRDHNEDAYLALPFTGLWAVADGMGGHAAGDVASRLVVDHLQQSFAHLSATQLDERQLRQAVAEANQALLAYSQKRLDGRLAGTTLVVLWCCGSRALWLWAGDSRGYRFRRGQLEQQTRDHSRVAELVAAGLLAAADAEQHPDAHVITRALGVHSELELEGRWVDLLPGDQFLLCSDGLSRELTDAEIGHALTQGQVVNGGQALLHGALVRGARDNVTCIVVRAEAGRMVSDDAPTIPLLR